MAKFNVTSTEEATQIISSVNSVSLGDFINVEVDGIELTEITKTYTFDSLGEHTVKYSLVDSTIVPPSMFSGLHNLTKVIIPNSVTSIGNSAFVGCGNIEVMIPNSVTSIGQGAFGGSGIVTINIPDSVTSIGDSAFGGCFELTELTIPSSVTYIGTAILQGIYNSEVFSKLIFNAKIDVPNDLVSGCRKVTCITLGDGVTGIGSRAFSGCSSLTSITIPDSVTSIGNQAFQGCSALTSITIPDSVTSIDYMAFGTCSSLTSVTIPGSIINIAEQAFVSCSNLKNVEFLYGVQSIGNSAFAACSLTDITFSDSIKIIDESAFAANSLTAVTIPSSVTSIKKNAFYNNNNLSSVTILATTPPELGITVFEGNASGRKFYVPSESLDVYKAAEGWSTYASDIYPIE